MWTRQGRSTQSSLGHWGHIQPHWIRQEKGRGKQFFSLGQWTYFMWTRQGESTQSILRSIIHHEKGTVESQPWHRRDVTTPRSQNVWQILNVSTILISQLTTPSLLCIQPVVFTINTGLIAATPSLLHILSIYHQYQYRIDCSNSFPPAHSQYLPSISI